MHKRIVVIVTSSYPFTRKELFLENELEFLLKEFSKVILVPLGRDGDRRALPEGVEVITDVCKRNSDSSVVGYIGKLSKVFGCGHFYRELLSKPKSFANIKSLRYLIGFFSYGLEGADILKKLIESRPELENAIFYSYWMHVHSFCLAILKSGYFPQLTVVSRAHRYDLYEELCNPPFIPARNMTLNTIDQIFPVSEDGKKYLENKGICSKKLITSYLGVPPSSFRVVSSGDNAFSIVSCSYTMPVKRVDIIIDAVACLAKTNPRLKIQWNHLGGGELYDDLIENGKKILPKNVDWKIHGEMSNAEVYQFYKKYAVDVFVSTSYSEGLPVSMMEAASCGIPIVSSNVGGVSEIVSEKNGVLLSANPSPSDVSDAFQKFIDNRDVIASMQNHSIEVWNSKFHREKNYQHFIEQLLC